VCNADHGNYAVEGAARYWAGLAFSYLVRSIDGCHFPVFCMACMFRIWKTTIACVS